MKTINKNNLKNNEVRIGDGQSGDKKLSFNDGSANLAYIKHKNSTGKLLYSDTGLEGNEVDISTGDAAYIHTQSTPNTVWNINHSLKKYPSVTVVDSANKIWECAIEYIDIDNVKITIAFAFSGKAYLN